MFVICSLQCSRAQGKQFFRYNQHSEAAKGVTRGDARTRTDVLYTGNLTTLNEG